MKSVVNSESQTAYVIRFSCSNSNCSLCTAAPQSTVGIILSENNYNYFWALGPVNSAVGMTGSFRTLTGSSMYNQIPISNGGWTYGPMSPPYFYSADRAGVSWNSNPWPGPTGDTSHPQLVLLQLLGYIYSKVILLPGYYTVSLFSTGRNSGGGGGANTAHIALGTANAWNSTTSYDNEPWTQDSFSFSLNSRTYADFRVGGIVPSGDQTILVDGINIAHTFPTPLYNAILNSGFENIVGSTSGFNYISNDMSWYGDGFAVINPSYDTTGWNAPATNLTGNYAVIQASNAFCGYVAQRVTLDYNRAYMFQVNYASRNAAGTAGGNWQGYVGIKSVNNAAISSLTSLILTSGTGWSLLTAYWNANLGTESL